MSDLLRQSTPVTWHIFIKDTPPSRERLCGLVRPILERRLSADPEISEISCESPLGTIELRRQGNASPEAPIRLAFSPTHPPLPGGGGTAQADVPILTLPNEEQEAKGKRLVGLEEIHESVLQQFRCRWDGALDTWSQHTGQAIPNGVRAYFTSSTALFIFAGDPGTGKSVSPPVIVDRYCREKGIAGHLVRQGTEVRGNGTVGDFGNQIRAAFRRLAALPEDDFKTLVLEEAEAVGMRRSEGQAHQEDRAGTSTLLQCLDTYSSLRRFAVFCTTNLLEALDAALIRRAVPFTFARPNREARYALLADWLPDFPADALAQAAVVSDGMTGNDLVQALTSTFVAALRADRPICQEQVLAALVSTPRTGRV